MNAVIGLLPSRCNISREIEILNLVGFKEDDIHLITQEKKIRRLLKCELSYLTKKYLFMAVVIWLIVSYSIIGLLSNWYGSKLIDFNEMLSTTTIVFITLFGSTVSAAIGLVICRTKYKNDVDLFIKRFRKGDSVIEVCTTHRDVDKAKRILEQGCATCVRTLQEQRVG